MRDPPVFGTAQKQHQPPGVEPNQPKTMLKQGALIAFASSAAMALQPSNLQTLQRGLHTHLAASSRRKTSFRAPPQHDVSRAGP